MRSTVVAALCTLALVPACATADADAARLRAAEASYRRAASSSAALLALDAATVRLVDRALALSAAVRRVHAANLANAATPGFRRGVPVFGRVPLPTPDADAGPLGIEVLRGVRPDPTCGALRPTGRPLDLAIDGDGLLAVLCTDGRFAYCRGGALQLDARRRLATAAGHVVLPEVTVPAAATGLRIAADGGVWVTLPGRGTAPVAQLVLHAFPAPGDLEPAPDGCWQPVVGAGAPRTAPPGTAGLGGLCQGVLEQSNVDPVYERAALDLLDERRSRLLELLR